MCPMPCTLLLRCIKIWCCCSWCRWCAAAMACCGRKRCCVLPSPMLAGAERCSGTCCRCMTRRCPCEELLGGSCAGSCAASSRCCLAAAGTTLRGRPGPGRAKGIMTVTARFSRGRLRHQTKRQIEQPHGDKWGRLEAGTTTPFRPPLDRFPVPHLRWHPPSWTTSKKSMLCFHENETHSPSYNTAYPPSVLLGPPPVSRSTFNGSQAQANSFLQLPRCTSPSLHLHIGSPLCCPLHSPLCYPPHRPLHSPKPISHLSLTAAPHVQPPVLSCSQPLVLHCSQPPAFPSTNIRPRLHPGLLNRASLT